MTLVLSEGDVESLIDMKEVFSWESAVELGTSRNRTLFKSGGAALEDVAVASIIYDKAAKSSRSYTTVGLV